MAEIQDYQGFKIKITPEYTNWWSYYIEFSYKDKPLFNPEIAKGFGIKADEYSSWALLPTIEKALQSRNPGESFRWNEWEDEAHIEILYVKFNALAEDGFFIFDAFVSSWFFEGGGSNTMNQPAGLRLEIYEREELKKFYNDLNNEMLEIYNSIPEDHKRERMGSVPKPLK